MTSHWRAWSIKYFLFLFVFYQRPNFWKSQSRLSNGQTCRVFSQREMQWKWNAWLHMPHATVHSSLVADAWFAWHSIHRSMMWFLQMAQLSTTMSQAQRATAFHFLTSNRSVPPSAADPPAALEALADPLILGFDVGASDMSTSAIELALSVVNLENG